MTEPGRPTDDDPLTLPSKRRSRTGKTWLFISKSAVRRAGWFRDRGGSLFPTNFALVTLPLVLFVGFFIQPPVHPATPLGAVWYLYALQTILVIRSLFAASASVKALLRTPFGSHWQLTVAKLFANFATIIWNFTVSYWLIANKTCDVGQSPCGQFAHRMSHIDAVYFTVTVLATVGFGDITPVGGLARAVVTVQMLVDLTLIATLLALLTHWITLRVSVSAVARPPLTPPD